MPEAAERDVVGQVLRLVWGGLSDCATASSPREMALFLNYTQKKFGQDKRDTLTRFCRECDVRFACNGGCPKDRFATSPYGEPGQHHLCPGYQDFFHHVREPMEAMMLLLRQGCAPSELMSSHALDDSARGGCSRL